MYGLAPPLSHHPPNFTASAFALCIRIVYTLGTLLQRWVLGYLLQETRVEGEEQSWGEMNSGVDTQARAFAGEVRGSLETKDWMLDLGHPLLNRVAESFAKAAGVRQHAAPEQLRSAGSLHYCLLIPCVSADRRSAGGRQGIVLHGD